MCNIILVWSNCLTVNKLNVNSSGGQQFLIWVFLSNFGSVQVGSFLI